MKKCYVSGWIFDEYGLILKQPLINRYILIKIKISGFWSWSTRLSRKSDDLAKNLGPSEKLSQFIISPRSGSSSSPRAEQIFDAAKRKGSEERIKQRKKTAVSEAIWGLVEKGRYRLRSDWSPGSEQRGAKHSEKRNIRKSDSRAL